MPYPLNAKITVPNIFGTKIIDITFNSGLTIFVGPNASGKTQSMKALKNQLNKIIGHNKMRYLSSNRIGLMEQYRSKACEYDYTSDSATFGNLRTKEQRLRIETAVGDFMTLDEKKDVFIKVSERLSALFSRQIYLEWDSGNLKVYFESTNNIQYTAASEASGLINLVSILAALYDDSVKVLFIDEPEVSLHPQLQAFLLQEIKKVCGDYEDTEEHRGKKMVVLSTHATEMIDIVDPTDIVNYVFFTDLERPKQILLEEETLKSEKLQEFVLKMGYSYKAAFFAKKVLLVEGISDYMMCKYLNARFQYNLESAGVQMIPVEGKGQFPIIEKLMRLIGKEVIILTDMDSFIDDNSVVNLFNHSLKSKELAIEKSHADMQAMITTVKNSVQNLYNNIVCSSVTWYETHPYWKNKNEENVDKAKKRAVISCFFSLSDTQMQPFATEINCVKKQLDVLFSVLEQLGCFILRKGALESYYIFADNNVYDGKPSEVIKEISYLKDQADSDVKEKYNDFIRLLQYSSKKQTVDESNSIRQELLSEITAIVDVLKQKSEKEIDQIVIDSSVTQIAKSIIKKLKKTDKMLFDYKLFKSDKVYITVELHSKIITVAGFPLTMGIDSNLNEIIYNKVKQK